MLSSITFTRLWYSPTAAANLPLSVGNPNGADGQPIRPEVRLGCAIWGDDTKIFMYGGRTGELVSKYQYICRIISLTIVDDMWKFNRGSGLWEFMSNNTLFPKYPNPLIGIRAQD